MEITLYLNVDASDGFMLASLLKPSAGFRDALGLQKKTREQSKKKATRTTKQRQSTELGRSMGKKKRTGRPGATSPFILTKPDRALISPTHAISNIRSTLSVPFDSPSSWLAG